MRFFFFPLILYSDFVSTNALQILFFLLYCCMVQMNLLHLVLLV
ncbi:290R [Invertebrate iridescent virus Kaz2018]|uniref:290R n=1 Tax=Invertebrate iridescent virus 6 TaxID=176652 RepID=Q91FN4_IIV6|nr:290R [Invertebrate iridescent virus 6]AAK82151.1 290R [Invertebrate iridescent virus 6]QNH08700.1 290R [Invertebrate iridescent virus Kaz2018]